MEREETHSAWLLIKFFFLSSKLIIMIGKNMWWREAFLGMKNNYKQHMLDVGLASIAPFIFHLYSQQVKCWYQKMF